MLSPYKGNYFNYVNRLDSEIYITFLISLIKKIYHLKKKKPYKQNVYKALRSGRDSNHPIFFFLTN